MSTTCLTSHPALSKYSIRIYSQAQSFFAKANNIMATISWCFGQVGFILMQVLTTISFEIKRILR